MRYRLRTLLVTIAIIAAVLALPRHAATLIYPSVIYEAYAEFAEMPSHDDALVRWLQAQPGVVSTVHVNREQNAVRVVWIMSRNLTGFPPIPDLRNNFEQLGYTGLKRYEPR